MNRKRKPPSCDLCGGLGGHNDKVSGPFDKNGPVWICKACVAKVCRQENILHPIDYGLDTWEELEGATIH